MKLHQPELERFVDDIIKTPSGPKKWGMAINAWLAKNEIIDTPEGPMTARQYNALQIAYNKRLREEATNKFAATDSGALRLGLSIPEGAWAMVKLFDPPAFNQGFKNDDMVKHNLKKFMESFPQYTIGVY